VVLAVKFGGRDGIRLEDVAGRGGGDAAAKNKNKNKN
jgi:hypothetical protein